MILEAFSSHLRSQPLDEQSPERVLYRWLTGILLMPPSPNDMIGRVIHTEIELVECEGCHLFEGKSASGRRLLNSLILYCRSYDQWQFSRWLHERRASDFSRKSGF